MSQSLDKMVRIQIYLAGALKPAALASDISIDENSFVRNLPVERLIIVDGGLYAAQRHAATLYAAHEVWFVGDSDSVDRSQLVALEKNVALKRFDLPTDKDVSDFGATLDALLGLQQTPHVLEIFNALGDRCDHELVNLFEIERYVAACRVPVVVLCEPHMIFSNRSFKIENRVGALFSVLKSTAQKLELTGSQYEGRVVLNRPSHGLSNKICKQKFFVNLPLCSGYVWIVFPSPEGRC